MFRRNRKGGRVARQLGTAVTAAVFGYGAYKLVDWALHGKQSSDWTWWKPIANETAANGHARDQVVVFDETSKQEIDASRPEKWQLRRQRMTRCREETIKALEGFLPTLRQAIEDRTSTSQETQALKDLRAMRGQGDESIRRTQEKDLWDEIKIKNMTRMIATAYAHTILFMTLTVQVNLLGGRLLEEQLRHTSAASLSDDTIASDRMSSYQTSHRFVLTHTYEYFFQHGLESLISTVESAVSDVVADWNVMDSSALHMTRERFDEAIREIRQVVEGKQRSPRGLNSRPRSVMRFLMPPSALLETSIEDDLARSILDETWDILESPVLADAHKDCLSTTFQMMRDRYWGIIFEANASTSPPNAHWTTKPLAHVLTQLKHTSNSFYKKDDRGSTSLTMNSYSAMMEALPSVLELGDVSFN
jgi:peroxin-3